MVPILAMKAVETKIARHTAILVGNYEFYYTAGRYARMEPSLGLSADMKPGELKDVLMEHLDESTFTPADTDEKYVMYLLHRYRPAYDEYNETMRGLFRWGETGEDPFPADASEQLQSDVNSDSEANGAKQE